MNAIFNKIPSRFLIRIGFMLLSALLLSETIALFLPATTRSYQSKDTFVAHHFYRLSQAFYPSGSVVTQTQEPSKNYTPLTAWSLQALYQQEGRGFIVVAIHGKKHFISIGEAYDGYTLIHIRQKQAILKRNGVEYELSLEVQSPQSIASAAKKRNDADVKALEQGIVRRTDINNYMADPRMIWSNISINLYRKAGRIKGFLVKRVTPNSVFDHLGLKSGDIIVEANGIEMKSIKAAQDLYKHIDEIDNVAIKVKRDNQIKELTYEIQ